jgi:hypothetical protein
VLCAAAESLALATKSELEIEARLKSEDPASMATTITASGDAEPDRGARAGLIDFMPALDHRHVCPGGERWLVHEATRCLTLLTWWGAPGNSRPARTFSVPLY